MRSFVLATAILVGGAVLAGDSAKKPRGHPHFNDGGTIPWSTELADASAAAKKEGKLVFIEYGREL